MTKTAEELYEEKVWDLGYQFIKDHLNEGVDFLTVSEGLYDEDEDDDDLTKDVYDYVNAELDTILQRWLDSDN